MALFVQCLLVPVDDRTNRTLLRHGPVTSPLSTSVNGNKRIARSVRCDSRALLSVNLLLLCVCVFAGADTVHHTSGSGGVKRVYVRRHRADAEPKLLRLHYDESRLRRPVRAPRQPQGSNTRYYTRIDGPLLSAAATTVWFSAEFLFSPLTCDSRHLFIHVLVYKQDYTNSYRRIWQKKNFQRSLQYAKLRCG